jgi:flagellar basal-body rod protein FlgC
MDPLSAASATAFSSLEAQSLRMRVLAENIANAESTGRTPGSDPYRRKTISFVSALNEASGVPSVRVAEVGTDNSEFPIENRPGHPAADPEGNVKLPNVNMIVEMTDMRLASRAYEASLQVIRQGREMSASLVDLLRG